MMIRRHPQRSNDRLGFTLMEVLVVVAILVVLAGVSTVAVFSYLEGAKQDRAKSDLQTLTDACKAYKLRNDGWPTSLQDLLAGNRPLLETQESILDPWGNEYRYNLDGPNNGGRRPDISCVDEDGVEIGNWMSTKGAN